MCLCLAMVHATPNWSSSLVSPQHSRLLVANPIRYTSKMKYRHSHVFLVNPDTTLSPSIHITKTIGIGRQYTIT